MGTGTSEVPGGGEDGSGAIRPKSASDPSPTSSGAYDGHDELRSLLIKNIMWMLAGLGVIVVGLVAVAFIANSGRISSDTGNDLIGTGFKTQKRNACITDLRNESDFARGEVLQAVLNRLVVLDGVDPKTGEPLPRYINEDGESVIDTDAQGELAAEYVQEGLRASARSTAAANKLLQPTLNKLCGEPIVTKEDLEN